MFDQCYLDIRYHISDISLYSLESYSFGQLKFPMASFRFGVPRRIMEERVFGGGWETGDHHTKAHWEKSLIDTIWL